MPGHAENRPHTEAIGQGTGQQGHGTGAPPFQYQSDEGQSGEIEPEHAGKGIKIVHPAQGYGNAEQRNGIAYDITGSEYDQ